MQVYTLARNTTANNPRAGLDHAIVSKVQPARAEPASCLSENFPERWAIDAIQIGCGDGRGRVGRRSFQLCRCSDNRKRDQMLQRLRCVVRSFFVMIAKALFKERGKCLEWAAAIAFGCGCRPIRLIVQ